MNMADLPMLCSYLTAQSLIACILSTLGNVIYSCQLYPIKDVGNMKGRLKIRK